MDLGIIVTAILGIITSVASSWATWFFARKKYNSEVDGNLIDNMQKALSYYLNLCDDNKRRLDELLVENKELRNTVAYLNIRIDNLTESICTDLLCQMRRREGATGKKLSDIKKQKSKENKPINTETREKEGR